MPPMLGFCEPDTQVRAHALPALEALAANLSRLDRSLNNRFERDDPPAYVSSSDSEGNEVLYHPVLRQSQAAALEAFSDVVSMPLTDSETKYIASTLYGTSVYNPGFRYRFEEKRERDRLNSFRKSISSETGSANSHVRDSLKGPRGKQRLAIIVRHNIKKRWRRLGIWNPEWGIPGREDAQLKDTPQFWKWKWQRSTDPPCTTDPSPLDPQHPVYRAVQLRRNIAYREHAPPPPRSCLRDDSSAPEAESFIISRPWFAYQVEYWEQQRRMARIPMAQRGYVDPNEDGVVAKRWKERGDWEPTWKWRHESPSPEPEDLTPLNTGDVDFTPSEVDALEAIPPCSPPRSPTAAEKHRAIFSDVPPQPLDSLFELDRYYARMCAERQDAADEPGDQAVKEVEEQPLNPPPPRRPGRPRRQFQSAEAVAAPPRPPPRRSTRIAARNTNPPPPTLPTAAPRRTRTRIARGPQAPAAAPRRNASSTVDALRKRGRPRKTQEGNITKPTTPRSKRAKKH